MKLIECVSYLFCSFNLIWTKFGYVWNTICWTTNENTQTTQLWLNQNKKNTDGDGKKSEHLTKYWQSTLQLVPYARTFIIIIDTRGARTTMLLLIFRLRCASCALACTIESCAQAGVARTMVCCQPARERDSRLAFQWHRFDYINLLMLRCSSRMNRLLHRTVCKNRKQQTHWTTIQLCQLQPEITLFREWKHYMEPDCYLA